MVDANRAPSEQAEDTAAGTAAGTRLGLQVELPRPDIRVVRVAGEIDLLTSSQLADCLNSELAHHPAHLIADLAGVTYLGSTGLEVLVTARATAEAGSTRLWLTGTTAALVRRPLEWTGLLPLFPCRDTVDEVLAELQ
jgi:anti-anti-sigma factor